MKTFLLRLNLLLLSLFIGQQMITAQSLSWAGQVSGPNSKQLNGMVTDSQGNLYSIISFTGTADIDPGPGAVNLTTTRVNYDHDFVVIKQAPDGTLLWYKRFGGDSIDIARRMTISPDGFLDILGDFRVTVDFDPGPGVVSLSSATANQDPFYLRLDLDGNFIFVKHFPSTINGSLYGRTITTDNDGNVIIGFTFSGTIDFDPGPADASLTSGGVDIAFCKFSHDGTFLWAKCFAGDYQTDMINTVTTDKDNNILLGGYFGGTVDFEPGAGVFNMVSAGANDAFIVKLNPAGDLLWAKQFGDIANGAGVSGIVSDAAGNIFYAGGFSGSVDLDAGAGVAYFYCNTTDVYLIKLQPGGEFLWAKTIGNSNTVEYAATLLRSSDGSLIIPVGFNSSFDADPDSGIQIVNTNGDYDIAFITLNANGEFGSVKSIGGTGGDNISTSHIDQNNSLYFAGIFDGAVDFDPGPAFNILTSVGLFPYCDMFQMKLATSNYIKGITYFDINNDGTQQGSEPALANVIIRATRNGLNYYGISDTTGHYLIQADTLNYTISPALPLYYSSFNPLSHSAAFGSLFGQQDTANHFGLFPANSIRDVAVAITNLGPARPGRSTIYRITYTNIGTETISGNIVVTKDPLLTFSSADPAPFSFTNPTITWNFAGLAPSQSSNIDVRLDVLPQATLGTFLKTYVNINTTNDFNLLNNVDSLNHVVITSFDPNEKEVFPDGAIRTTFVSNGKELDYTIRFQNTGNDTAFLIVVRDTLSANLDISSFRMISASHPYSVSLKGNGILEWKFNNILLPDSNVNEAASHGYVRYRIKAKTSLIVGDEIKNKAAIYFDYNSSVLTNETMNIIVQDPLPLQLLSFEGKKGNNRIHLYWNTTAEKNTSYFVIEHATHSSGFFTIGKLASKGSYNIQNNYEFDDLHPTDGTNYYRLRIVDLDGSFYYSPIIEFEFTGNDIFSVTPNPATNFLIIKHPVGENGQIKVIDQNGRVLINKVIQNSTTETQLNIKQLPVGIYTITWSDKNKTRIKKVIKY